MTFSDGESYDLVDDIKAYFDEFRESTRVDVLKGDIAAGVPDQLHWFHANVNTFWIIWWVGRNRPATYYTATLRFLDNLLSKISIDDEDLIGDSYTQVQLIDALHVAAARVLCLERRDGLSEEAANGAREAICLMKRLCLVTGWENCPDWTTIDDGLILESAELASALAVDAMMKLELSREAYRRGEYTESLELVAAAAAYYESAAEEANAELPLGAILVTDPDEIAEWQSLPEDSAEFDSRDEHDASEDLRARIAHHLDGLPFSLNEANVLWQQVMANGHRVSDWGVVIDNCSQLMETSPQAEETDWVSNRAGDEVNWRELWLTAKTEAEGQMRPDKLVERYDRLMETLSEDRIKMYVFADLWENVNDGCKAALINADMILNAREERRRFEAILNELRKAAEEMCYQFVWSPLRDSEGLSDISDFRNLQRSLGRKTSSLIHFSKILKAKHFEVFLKERNLAPREVRFLTRRLPHELGRLRTIRNPAEHEFGKRQLRSKVMAIYNSMLGCGELGVLPEFARIGPKIFESRIG